MKYLWVSKRLISVPIINDDGSIRTDDQRIVAESRGHTYVRAEPKKMSKRRRRKLDKMLGLTKIKSDILHRLGCADPEAV